MRLPPRVRNVPPENGHHIRTVRELLGHKDVKTTMDYTHVPDRGSKRVGSAMDGLPRKAG